jgi:hypothetical protein
MEPGADGLRWCAGQRRLTPKQETQVKRVARAYCHDQLSTELVDEQEAVACLRQVYTAAGRAVPRHIRWLDGPLQLVHAFDPDGVGLRVEASVWDDVKDTLTDYLKADLWSILGIDLEDALWALAEDNLLDGNHANDVDTDITYALGVTLGDSQWQSAWARPEDGLKHDIRYSVGGSVNAGVAGYATAFWLGYYHSFALSLGLDALRAFCRFNQLVSGYWLGAEVALLVRRPTVLMLDAAGHLHNASGKCVEYRDGWGFYAWHEIPVAARIILKPETLTRDDFFQESNLEVRRIIQERMGERFVAALGGRVLDTDARGTLYEVRLPEDDPEGVARYVQVQDASSSRTYFLRVPPTAQTATEAVAWTFSRTSEEYHPEEES